MRTTSRSTPEDNDISGWGRPRGAGSTLGLHMDSGIRAFCGAGPTLQRVTIQRNRIRDPRYPSMHWGTSVPAGGPQAITFSHCGGNHVVRHNDIYSNNGNHFFDIIGGEDNFTDRGFPYADTDIYANRLLNGYDDAIEAEGRGMNVRIWGNYLDSTGTGIATTITATGPTYVFRNVWNRNRFYPHLPPDQDQRQPFSKAGSYAPLGYGRRYIFHNTMLQAEDPNAAFTLGGGHGLGGTGVDQPVANTLSMNNIYHLWKTTASTFFQIGADTQAIRDMTNGNPSALPIVDGIYTSPEYAEGNGWKSESGGQYALKSGSPGYDAAAPIPNFNDTFVGSGPDIGAHEAGSGSMKFATAASPGASYLAGTLTASAEKATQDQGIVFAVSVWASGAMPSATVAFLDGDAPIPGCAALTLAGGVASCTAALSPGSHQIRAQVSAASPYETASAGPVTVTAERR